MTPFAGPWQCIECARISEVSGVVARLQAAVAGQLDGGAQDGGLAALEASLHQVEMELAREREQWHQRQEIHRAEAQALRHQLHRLHENQDMLSNPLYPQASANSATIDAVPWVHDAALEQGNMTQHDMTQHHLPVEAAQLLQRMRQVEEELEAVTHDKFELQERLLSSQAELASLTASDAAGMPDQPGAQHAVRDQLMRARQAKIAADQAHAQVARELSGHARQTRADMLIMAKHLITLHHVVDATLAALEGVAHGQRQERAALERRDQQVTLETQRLQMDLDHSYALVLPFIF